MQRHSTEQKNRLHRNFLAALDLLDTLGREPDRWEEECLSYALGALACGLAGERWGWSYGFGAATPADLKGYTAVRDTFDTTNLYFEFVVYNSSFNAADIIANQYIDIDIKFTKSGLTVG